MDVLRRALSDSFHHVGRIPAVSITIGGGFAGWLLLGVLSGRRIMAGEVNPAISAVLGVVCVWVAIFIYNLIASPFRIERDAGKVLASELAAERASVAALSSEMEDLRSQQPKLVISVSQSIQGGTHQGFPGKIFVGCILSVANLGRSPSAAINWQILVVTPEGEAHLAELNHLFGKTTLGFMDDKELAFKESEIIYNKTAAPISVGSIVGGFFMGCIHDRDLNGCLMRVSCCDVFGNVSAIDIPLGAGEETGQIPYSPFVNARFGPKE